MKSFIFCSTEKMRYGALAATSTCAAALVLARHRMHDRRPLSETDVNTARARHSSVDLDLDGVVVLRAVLSTSGVDLWRRIVLDATKRGAQGVVESSAGRSHVVVRSSFGRETRAMEQQTPNAAQLRLDLEAIAGSLPLASVAAAYFAVHSPACAYRVTQLQLLDAIEDSHHQIWHRDNAKPGLTCIIALGADGVGTNGPTELLLGSHGSLVGAVRRKEPPLLGSLLKAGDALVYDARVLHRGRGFAVGERRPVLVIRWDSDRSPAPGVGALGTLVQRGLGASLAFAAAFHV